MKKNKLQFTGKQIAFIIALMFCLILIYFIASGTFHVNSSYKDVMTFSDYEKVADENDWQVFFPENKDLVPYFYYTGKQYPKANIYVKGIVWDNDTPEYIEWYPFYDEYFFFGEKRYYFPIAYDRLDKFAFQIVWSKYNDEKSAFSNITSDSLSMMEKEEATKYFNSLPMENENNLKPH